MPTPRNTEHKIAAGTKTIAQMASEPLLSAFPLQSDQDDWFAWEIDTRASQYPRRAGTFVAANGARKGQGLLEGTLVFSYLTNGMLSYLKTLLGISGTTTQSAVATIQTYDETDTPITLNCLIEYPPAEMSAVLGGWQNVVLRYYAGKVAS